MVPKPWKDPEIQNRIRAWIQKNPDRWYTAHFQDIAVEAKGFSPWSGRLDQKEIDEIEKLYRYGNSSSDIVFMTGRSRTQVEKIRRRMEASQSYDDPASSNTENVD